MKRLNLILVIFMSAVMFTACEKEEGISPNKNTNTTNNKESQDYFAEKLNGDTEVEVIIGSYIECGDGSATCLPGPLCAIIVTATVDLLPSGNYLYHDGEVEFHISNNETRTEEFSTLEYAVTSEGTSEYPNAISTLNWE